MGPLLQEHHPHLEQHTPPRFAPCHQIINFPAQGEVTKGGSLYRGAETFAEGTPVPEVGDPCLDREHGQLLAGCWGWGTEEAKGPPPLPHPPGSHIPAVSGGGRAAFLQHLGRLSGQVLTRGCPGREAPAGPGLGFPPRLGWAGDPLCRAAAPQDRALGQSGALGKGSPFQRVVPQAGSSPNALKTIAGNHQPQGQNESRGGGSCFWRVLLPSPALWITVPTIRGRSRTR